MNAISPLAETQPTYVPPPADEATPASVVHADPLAELAALLVETDFLRSEADERAMRAAREAERRAMEREVRALNRAADAVLVGACVQGGAALLGGSAECVGAVLQAPNEVAGKLEAGLQKGGKTLASLAEPLGGVFGDAPKARADADATEARNAGERADTRADQASEHRERVLRHTDSVVELVESALEAEHQGNFAILGNF